MNRKQLNRMRIMNGLPPVKEKAVEAKVEEKPALLKFQEADPGTPNPPYFYYHWEGKVYQKPVYLDPENFTPRKGILTRYGRKLLKEGAKYYGRLVVKNVDGDISIETCSID